MKSGIKWSPGTRLSPNRDTVGGLGPGCVGVNVCVYVFICVCVCACVCVHARASVRARARTHAYNHPLYLVEFKVCVSNFQGNASSQQGKWAHPPMKSLHGCGGTNFLTEDHVRV